jgi:hypothetical protein
LGRSEAASASERAIEIPDSICFSESSFSNVSEFIVSGDFLTNIQQNREKRMSCGNFTSYLCKLNVCRMIAIGFTIRPGLALSVLLVLTTVSCRKNEAPAAATPHGAIAFTVENRIEGEPVEFNQLIYTNAAGNNYMITDLMYFISDITCYRSDGSRCIINHPRDIFYIDEKSEASRVLAPGDEVPTGDYDSITFVFGIPEAKNSSNRFVNPPEVFMGWPVVLGGGYHYMMMNGKWTDPQGVMQPFNLHLGRGQLYRGDSCIIDSIYAFVPNCFTVSLPGSSFRISDGETAMFRLTMNIENWFDDPYVYDHNHWGGAIMQNQPAMQMARENGHDVFSIVKL